MPVQIEAVHENTDQALWGIKTVAERTGLSRATVYRYTARGLIPPQRRVGPGRVAWLASEVIEWIESRPKVPRRRRKIEAPDQKAVAVLSLVSPGNDATLSASTFQAHGNVFETAATPEVPADVVHRDGSAS